MPAFPSTVMPRPVTIAVRLLYAVAVLPLISAVLQTALHTTEAFAVPLSVVSLLLTALLAYHVGRGKNVARILVWVFTVLETVNITSYALLTASGGPADRPGWYVPFVVAQGVLQAVVMIAVSVLLAVPVARPHFWHRPPDVTPDRRPADEHREPSPQG
jgi:hypothetical protein